jgi:hypothetical protein
VWHSLVREALPSVTSTEGNPPALPGRGGGRPCKAGERVTLSQVPLPALADSSVIMPVDLHLRRRNKILSMSSK